MEGKPEEHDRVVLDGVKDLAQDCEIVVFAQGSMARLRDNVEGSLKEKIFTSPELGVRQAREVLGLK
jgi:hypothetical protein